MEKIDIRHILIEKAPALFEKYPTIVSSLFVNFLEKLLWVKEVNEFIEQNKNAQGLDFIDALFDYLNFSYNLSGKSKRRIPSEGKLVVVSNHPLGGLDGLALIKAVSEVRKDVKIVANDVLANLENLRDLFLPFDLYSARSQKENITKIENALANDEAVIFFPAGEVSRMSLSGIKDGKWKKGAFRFASKIQAPILPAFIIAKNSFLFYGLSLLWRRVGMFLLPGELFRQRNKTITIKFGDPIPSANFDKNINIKVQLALLRKHVYRIGSGEKGIFNTEKTIIHPVPVRLIKHELYHSERLGSTNDGKKIFLIKADSCPNVMREISRLREITFRKVGEGTGKSFDTDTYDEHYHHIVLWDDDDLEIVGSYRLGITSEIIEEKGIEGLYNASQFTIHETFNDVLSQSIELGRSFVQAKYWKTNALDYIWQGIGAFVMKNPQIRYLWGAVSISNSYSELAKAMIVYYYKKWYLGDTSFATPHKAFVITKIQEQEIEAMFTGSNHEEDFRILKFGLKGLGFSVPVLYRRYTELCNYGGAKFASFSVDEGFMNAIDGLIVVDLHALRDEYKERYYNQKSFNN